MCVLVLVAVAGGVPADGSGPVAARPQAAAGWTTHDTAHFRIQYTLGGEDKTTLAYATSVGTYLEHAYDAYDQAGFEMPKTKVGGDGKIDVILKSNLCFVTIPGFDCSTGGIAVPPDRGDWVTGGQKDNPLILLLTGRNDAFLKTLTAYELFHQVQYQMAGVEATLSQKFVREGQATAMEEEAQPDVNSYFRRINEYYADLHTAINKRPYDAAIFWKYLLDNFTSQVIRQFLDTYQPGAALPLLRSTLPSYGWTLEETMHNFALSSFFVGSRYDASRTLFDEDAKSWPGVSTFIGEHELGEEKTKVPVTSKTINGLSTRYVRVKPDSTVDTDTVLKIEAKGGPSVRGSLVHRRKDGTTEIEDMHLERGSAELEIDDFNYADTIEVVLVFSSAADEEVSFDYKLTLTLALDIAFAMDTTGSMSGSIEALKATAATTRALLATAEADFRIAITEFKDFPHYPYGWNEDYPYLGLSQFSKEQSVIDGGISELQAWGGANWPESSLSGIMGAINAEGIGEWRSGAKKSIIVMTDAPPHDPEPFTGHTRASVIAAARAGGIVIRPEPARFARVAGNAEVAETPIAIYAVIVGNDFQAYSAMSALASATGGKVFVTSYDTDNIAEAILDAITEISGEEPPPPSGNRPPNVSAAIADPSQLWPVNRKLVPVRITNVSDPDGDAVTIQVTGITQDEPLGREADADGVGTATARVRAARDGKGNGRVYAISFTATDARGASSSGKVTVCVPHDQGGNTVCTDDGPSYVSTIP